MSFYNLHNHTEYSLLDGLSNIEGLVQRVLEVGQEGISITDHGSVAGHLQLQKEADKYDLHAILGMEGYFTEDRNEKKGKKGENYDHITVLAQNDKGLSNLWALSSRASSEGFYYAPRFDWELLDEYSEGLIVTGGCMGGCVGKYLNTKEGTQNFEKVIERIGRFLKIMDGRFYLELHTYQSPEQREVNEAVVQVANSYSLPVVAVSDSHYLRSEDWLLHEEVTAIGMQKTLKDPKRMQHGPDQLAVYSESEVRSRLAYLPPSVVDEAIKNSVIFAEQCTARVPTGTNMPVFFASPEEDEEHLKAQLAQGFVDRIQDKIDPSRHSEYFTRLEYELGIILEKGFQGYFLTVADLVKWSKDNGLLIGPSRGSAGGSLLSYCLGITEVDPLQYGLIFERFLNPGRTSLPDIDIDFPTLERPLAREYLESKYGKDNVASIGTFSTVGLKGAIKDLVRAQDIPFKDGLDITKIVENAQILDEDADVLTTKHRDKFAPWIIKYPQLFQDIPRYVNHIRSKSVHASGVVWSKESLIGKLPLHYNDNQWVTQQDMHDVDEEGFVKLDMLIVRNLSTLMRAYNLANEHKNNVPHFYTWGDCGFYDDEAVWDSIATGKNIGLFQLESAGLRGQAKRFNARSIEDLAALIAGYRPGLLDARDSKTGMNLFEVYMQRRMGNLDVHYHHPIYKQITESTNGTLLYQEQCIRIVTDMAGYSLPEADDLRSYIGKKIAEKLNAERPKFIQGCITNGVSESTANTIFDEMAAHGRYSFNLSHAVGYALVAYWGAYMKYYYPVEYMTALLQTNPKKAPIYLRECKRLNIDVLGPDINHSGKDFTQTNTREIRYGLGKVKWTPSNSHWEQFKPFTSIEDIVERVDKRVLNKRAIQSLALVGALDSLIQDPNLDWSNSKNVLYSFLKARKEKKLDEPHKTDCTLCFGTKTLFECYCEEIQVDKRDVHELELLGTIVSSDPLAQYGDFLLEESTFPGMDHLFKNEKTRIGGLIIDVRKTVVKSGRSQGKEMAVINLEMYAPIKADDEDEDDDSMIELVIFPNEYVFVKDKLSVGAPVFVEASKLNQSLAVKNLIRLD